VALFDHWMQRAGTPDLYENPTDHSAAIIRQFQVKDFRMIFIILMYGNVVGFFVFTIEIARKLRSQIAKLLK